MKRLFELHQRARSEAEKSIIDDLRDYELRALAAFNKEEESFTMTSRAVIDDFMNKTFNPANIEPSMVE